MRRKLWTSPHVVKVAANESSWMSMGTTRPSRRCERLSKPPSAKSSSDPPSARENGFGYNPHLLLPDLGKTSAELPPDEKNARSHRGAATRALHAWLLEHPL